MEDNIQTHIDKDQIRYARLDRFLLYLLAGELGYLILLLLVGVVFTILSFATDFRLDIGSSLFSIFWPMLIYVVAFLLNALGGFAGIVLFIRTKHEGYPGTGHLLNWILLASTAWIFILAIVSITPGMTAFPD